MHHCRQSQVRGAITAISLAAAAIVATACDAATSSSNSPGLTALDGPMPTWVGCSAAPRFTGGGRIDPVDVGKVTFGFNVDGRDQCDSTGTVKGQMQVVFHETQTLVHTLTMEQFATFADPSMGVCGEWAGNARVKHVSTGSDWHEHRYFTQVCDKGEPGRGADQITFILAGDDALHQSFRNEVLTGGNIQAHKN